jgi:hypothetical protein
MTDNEIKLYEHVVKSSAMLDTLVALVLCGPVIFHRRLVAVNWLP